MNKTRLFLFLLFFLLPFPGGAHDFTAKLKGGQVLYFNITDTVVHAVELTYEGRIRDNHEALPSGRLELPRTVKFKDIVYTVTAIGPKAFSGATELEAVVIPGTVKKIDDFAFEDCKSLSSVLFPGSPVEFGEGVFYRCSSIENISFGTEWKDINLAIFRWSECLKRIVIPSRVEKITNLKAIATLEYVEVDPNNNSFSSADGLLLSKNGKTLFACPRARKGEIVVPEGVEKMQDGAFIDCLAIETLIFPESLKSLPYQEFSRNAALRRITFLSSQPLLNYKLEEASFFALQVANPAVKVFVPGPSVSNWQKAVYRAEGFISKESIKKIK